MTCDAHGKTGRWEWREHRRGPKKHLFPWFSEKGLKFVSRNRLGEGKEKRQMNMVDWIGFLSIELQHCPYQLSRLQDGGFTGNRVVVLVDELARVRMLRFEGQGF
jgi:hypothetical protein